MANGTNYIKHYLDDGDKAWILNRCEALGFSYSEFARRNIKREKRRAKRLERLELKQQQQGEK